MYSKYDFGTLIGLAFLFHDMWAHLVAMHSCMSNVGEKTMRKSCMIAIQYSLQYELLRCYFKPPQVYVQ